MSRSYHYYWNISAILGELHIQVTSLEKSEVRELSFFAREVDKEGYRWDESQDVDSVDEHEGGGVHAEKDGVFRFVSQVNGQTNEEQDADDEGDTAIKNNILTFFLEEVAHATELTTFANIAVVRIRTNKAQQDAKSQTHYAG